MQLEVSTLGSGAAQTMIDVSDKAFARAFNEGLVHQVVSAYRAGGRAGTKAQKSRSEVRGGGAKPWRQKGTGRARAGTIRSPLWRSGGVTFAAKPRDYSQKVNKKMYRAAMSSILSQLIREKRLLVVDEFTLEQPKTRELVQKLAAMDVDNVLIIAEQADKNLALAARNVPRVAAITLAQIEPVSLVGYEKIIMTVSVLKKIEERLS